MYRFLIFAAFPTLSISNGIVSFKIMINKMILIMNQLISHFMAGMFPSPLPMMYIFRSLFVLQGCVNVDDFNDRNLFLTAKLFKQGYRYNKIRKSFYRFFHRHSEFIVQYKIGLKTLLQQGISEPIFYGDLVITSKELLENLILVIYSKRLSNVIKTLYITWISCDILHA